MKRFAPVSSMTNGGSHESTARFLGLARGAVGALVDAAVLPATEAVAAGGGDDAGSCDAAAASGSALADESGTGATEGATTTAARSFWVRYSAQPPPAIPTTNSTARIATNGARYRADTGCTTDTLDWWHERALAANGLQERRQRLAVDVLHDENELAPHHDDVECVDDVRMMDTRREPRLVEEHRDELGIERVTLVQPRLPHGRRPLTAAPAPAPAPGAARPVSGFAGAPLPKSYHAPFRAPRPPK